MNVRGKELRKRIRTYFGDVKNHVCVFIYRGEMCVDVEYEDFYPESRVEEEIRSIIGNDCLLNVKREYSDMVKLEIVSQMVHQVNREVSNGIFDTVFLTFHQRLEKYNCIIAI